MSKNAWNGPPLISIYQAKPLLEAWRSGATDARTSLDLGISFLEVDMSGEFALIPNHSLGLSKKSLQKIAKEPRKVFRLDVDPPRPVSNFSETTGWMRSLCPTPSAPTVLVSGIPMHRIKGTDPIQDTKTKIQALSTPKGRVLDTATGLGYTAIQAARTADRVVSVELDPGAIEIARLNPWSAELFENPKIEQVIGDVAQVIRKLPSESFDAAIHDPPTIALGGDLYGESFYREVWRVLRRGGRLFHYVGDPNSALGARTFPGVMKRLTFVGFKNVQKHIEAFGVTASRS